MIVIILKCVGMAIAILFGIGCIFALMVMVAIARVSEEQKKQDNGELPFYCMELDSRCPSPELPCKECEVYQRKMGEKEYDNQN